MAELKYDLLLVPTLTDKKIYNQPWYKERLHTKYIKAQGKNDISQFLHGKNWTFVKDGLDDFRDGLPPPIEGDIIIHGPKGLSPNIQGSSDNISSVKQEAAPNRFSKDQVCYSRVTPLQQQRRQHIEEIEYGLKQHPLALYPHLEECMPPDVFEDVVDILDPEMNLASDEEDSYLEDPETDTLPTPPPNVRMELPREPTREGTEEQKLKNLYRWLPRKEEKAKHESTNKKQEKRSSSPSQDEHIKTVTKEFCDWVESLGGESNNIEESTIMSLFASGYETKPALSVPIHVVELTNVPPELRMSANVPPPPESKEKKMSESEGRKKDWTYSGTYEPSWVKFKYGAWYLSPQTWKRRFADEPLRDPKEIKDEETSEAKKKSNDLDGQLAPMHGAKAFIDFIDNKNTRKPEFLERVGEIQEQTAREEQARLEAEQQAKAKKLNQQDKAKGRK